MEKPLAPACERNKDPILEVLTQTLQNSKSVLEIGSGTGQHAVYFGARLQHLTWHTSDLPANHEGIRAWVQDAQLPNVKPPLVVDAAQDHWPVPEVDAVFTANTLHIMSWPLAQRLIAKVGTLLPKGGCFCVYGPFNYNGAYTSHSNAQFDIWLKNRDPQSAIRHFEEIHVHARQAGMRLEKDYEMPANNRLLHFIKE